MTDFIGRKTKEQVEMIKAIVALDDKNVSVFSSRDVSELCGIPSKEFAGAFKALANRCREFPALVLRAGHERIEMTNKSRRYVQRWCVNPEFKEKYWLDLKTALSDYQKLHGSPVGGWSGTGPRPIGF